MNNIEEFLIKLRESPSMRWVANEVDETISQGVSLNVKDAVTDNRFFELVPSADLPVKERNKRQNYETSRPFTEEEKIEVVLKAFEVMYLDLPEIRNSAIKNLNEFGFKFESIIFSSDDDNLLDKDIVHEIKFVEVSEDVEKYRRLHKEFIKDLDK